MSERLSAKSVSVSVSVTVPVTVTVSVSVAVPVRQYSQRVKYEALTIPPLTTPTLTAPFAARDSLATITTFNRRTFWRCLVTWDSNESINGSTNGCRDQTGTRSVGGWHLTEAQDVAQPVLCLGGTGWRGAYAGRGRLRFSRLLLR